MLIYLDLNCFNRPFDDQSQDRVGRETEAVFAILDGIVGGRDELVWSAVLEFENSQHPNLEHREEIARWSLRAGVAILSSEAVAARAEELVDVGYGALDAVHLASAEQAAADCFLTCDDRVLRRSRRTALSVRVMNPRDFVEEAQE